jgi:hypothetical protein
MDGGAQHAQMFHDTIALDLVGGRCFARQDSHFTFFFYAQIAIIPARVIDLDIMRTADLAMQAESI